MGKKRWESFVEREYLDTDYDFVENVLPYGTVDGTSFGLIADATAYAIVITEGEEHIKPYISSLDSILDSLKRGGVKVDKKDALASVERFAKLWEERIKSAGKWEEMVKIAEGEGAIKMIEGVEEKRESEDKGLLSRLARRFRK